MNNNDDDILAGGRPSDTLIEEIENFSLDTAVVVETGESEDNVTMDGGQMSRDLLHLIEDTNLDDAVHSGDTNDNSSTITSSDGMVPQDNVLTIDSGGPSAVVVEEIEEMNQHS